MKKLIFICLSLLLNEFTVSQNCGVLSDDYSNPNLWTKVSPTTSNEIFIASNLLNYRKSTDGKEERLYRSLPMPLNSNDDWEIELDFYPISGGVNNYSGHLPLSLTSGILDPLADCEDPKNCGPNHNFTNQNQDGISVFFGSLSPPSPSQINTFFQLHIKDNFLEWNSRVHGNQLIYAQMNSLYHLRLIKCSNSIELHVSKNGSALLGSPINYIIPSNNIITGLNTIQHCNTARGVYKRQLSAKVDNLCVKKNFNNAPDISGFQFVNSNNYYAKLFTCQGNQCFSFYSKDDDVNQSLNMKLLSALPIGASFSQSIGNRPIGKICWNPDTKDVGVYTFQIEVTDDNCITSSKIRTFSIEVIDGYDIGGPITVCNNDAPLSLPDPGTGYWKIGSPYYQNLSGSIFNPSLFNPGTYTMSYCAPKPGYLSECTGCWSIDVQILESPDVNIVKGEGFCQNSAPSILIATPPGGIWTGGPYISSNGVFSPSLASPTILPGNTVTYSVTFPNGCWDSETINIPVYQNGVGHSYDLGQVCSDEYISFDEGAYRYELIRVIDPSTNLPPPNFPNLPLILNGNTFHYSQFSNIPGLPSDLLYFFRAWFRTIQGCEYYIDYALSFISCACSDTLGQNLVLSGTRGSNFLMYTFNFTPTLNSYSQVLRYNWRILDANGVFIKTLESWDINSGLTGSSSLTYDFTSEFGTLFNCGFYDIYLQVVSMDDNNELSLCQTSINVPICNRSFFDNKKNEPVDVDIESKIINLSVSPSPCINSSSIKFELMEKLHGSVEIYNLLGNVIYKGKLQTLKKGSNSISINCIDLDPGMYVVHLRSDYNTNSAKFLVK